MLKISIVFQTLELKKFLGNSPPNPSTINIFKDEKSAIFVYF